LDDIVDEGLRKEANERPTPLADRIEKTLSVSAEFRVCTCKTLSYGAVHNQETFRGLTLWTTQLKMTTKHESVQILKVIQLIRQRAFQMNEFYSS
jgi:hypothetical protein